MKSVCQPEDAESLFSSLVTEEEQNQELYRKIDPAIEQAANRVRIEGPKAVELYKLAYETLAFMQAHKNADGP